MSIEAGKTKGEPPPLPPPLTRVRAISLNKAGLTSLHLFPGFSTGLWLYRTPFWFGCMMRCGSCSSGSTLEVSNDINEFRFYFAKSEIRPAVPLVNTMISGACALPPVGSLFLIYLFSTSTGWWDKNMYYWDHVTHRSPTGISEMFFFMSGYSLGDLCTMWKLPNPVQDRPLYRKLYEAYLGFVF